MRAAILRRLRSRTTQLKLLSALAPGGAMLDTREAQRLAARQLAAERAKVAPLFAPPIRLTVNNAKAELYRRLTAIGERLRNPIARPPSPTQDTLPHTRDPIAPIVPAVVPADQPVVAPGIFLGSGSPATELIDEREYPPRWRAQSAPLENLKASIATNEIISRRNGRWVG
jgi:hypothetical protein